MLVDQFISAKMRALLQERHLSIPEFSRFCHFPQSNVYGIFSGRRCPRLITLKRFCDALNISLQEFFLPDQNDPLPPLREEAEFLTCYRSLSTAQRAQLSVFFSQL